jgi:phosphatidylinositol alpha-1,6-mannosyltransferase
MRHLLVTNDFPPKVGGIQSLLWEWWRRLPPESFTVLTSPHRGAAAFDAVQPFAIERVREPVLLPHPSMVSRVRDLAARTGAELIVLDPAVPLGLIGPRLGLPYAVVLHGAEVTVPGRLPVTRPLLSRVLRGASIVISAGEYAAMEAERAARCPLPVKVIPPGVDVERFRPITPLERATARARYGLRPDHEVVVAVSRLVPRKGFDTLIRAAARLAPTRPNLRVLIAGSGRDERRLRRLVTETGAPVSLLGRVPDADLPDLYAMADVASMLCRTRWLGLEQEGFGIVFLEAAASGVPQLAGRSGGAAEAVEDGSTGIIVDRPNSVNDVAAGLNSLLDDPARLAAMGARSRTRAVQHFTYDLLSARLADALSAT